jgi:predicted amidohydrolase YtcJ
MTADRDLAIVNATVRTVDELDSVAQAVLVRNGQFAAVGSEVEIRAAAAPGTELIDVGGRTVVPGFIDPHNHLSLAAFSPDSVDCSTLPLASLDDLFEAIANHCAALPAGRWVRVIRFNPMQLREQRGPTRGELDDVAPRNPVFVIDVSCHAGWTNSLALAESDITGHTPQPWGGVIEKDNRGEPTGTLYEAATNHLHTLSWNAYAERDWDRSVELLQAKMADYLAAGITGVGDAMVNAKAAELYRRADAAGALTMTVQQLHHGDHFFAMQDLRRLDIVEQIKEANTDRLRGGTLKIFADPGYPDGPGIDHINDGCRTHAGSAFYAKEELKDLAVRAAELGIGTAIHAMGSCTVDAALDAYEVVRRRHDSGAVLRIEHAFVAEEGQGARMAELGVDLTVNPGLSHHFGPSSACGAARTSRTCGCFRFGA